MFENALKDLWQFIYKKVQKAFFINYPFMYTRGGPQNKYFSHFDQKILDNFGNWIVRTKIQNENKYKANFCD